MTLPTVYQECGDGVITFYRQMRADGVIVVTARCKNNHHPIKGKPFYSLTEFDNIKKLPMLPTQQPYKNYPLPIEVK